MHFPERYDPAEAEQRWQAHWADTHVYQFDPSDSRPIFAIDTPPPTVSGALHIGHIYSYVQAEAMVRFWRMRGENIFYPFGFDDNGLPTERYVEQSQGLRAHEIGREAFIAACLRTTEQVEARFEAFWQRLGISADWRLRYSTIDARARRTSQWSFLDLYRKGRIYHAQAPNPWCIECQTAIAQAEIDDAERETTFYDVRFTIADVQLPNEATALTIATTRPELLPACVAVFVHPDDLRFSQLVGKIAITPLFGRQVPILADPLVDREKGSGAVMCCTFGDSTDMAWWRTHNLPLIPLIGRDGRLSADGGSYTGLTLRQAKQQIVTDLRDAGAITAERASRQAVRTHERCGTPLEILETKQWFIRVLNLKAELLAAGRAITWHPEHMRSRYEHWVENLGWDWCISRQRFYGVPFPLWHCADCGAIVLADEAQLPVDPLNAAPPHGCTCGGELLPERDVLDTWATSSLSPQIAGELLDDPALFGQLFPFALRPQAHDIIRTWAFATIVKAHLHHGTIPWKTVLISGFGLDPSGKKLSKSKGNAATTPESLIERYSADAVRYWACGGRPGADQLLDEDAIKRGAKLVTKLWNASRLIGSIRDKGSGVRSKPDVLTLAWRFSAGAYTPLDRAMLSWLQRLVQRATVQMESYEYAAALDATERFFWATLCDNYLELIKGRMYDGSDEDRAAVQVTLHIILNTLLRLFAPFLPFITEEVWSHLYAEGERSIHQTTWPVADIDQVDDEAEQVGMTIFELVAQVRRFKSEQKLSLGAPLAKLTIGASHRLHTTLAANEADIRSATRAAVITLVDAEMLTTEAIV